MVSAKPRSQLPPSPSPMIKKVSRYHAGYRLSLNEETRCGKCRNFKRPNQCEMVDGDVRAQMLCDFFRAKPRISTTATTDWKSFFLPQGWLKR